MEDKKRKELIYNFINSLDSDDVDKLFSKRDLAGQNIFLIKKADSLISNEKEREELKSALFWDYMVNKKRYEREEQC